jgi:hypothetical protein
MSARRRPHPPRIAGEPAARRAARRGRCSTPARARASSPGREALPPRVALILGILEEEGLQREHLGQRVRLHRPGHRHPVRFNVGGLLPREVVFHRIMEYYDQLKSSRHPNRQITTVTFNSTIFKIMVINLPTLRL